MTRILVVGTGLFGSIITAALREAGHEVTTLSNNNALNTGSPPAACLMRQSWAVRSMPPERYHEAIWWLNKLYGVHDIEFDLPGGLTTKVQWVDPARVLLPPDIAADILDERTTFSLRGKYEVVVYATGTLRAITLPPSYDVRPQGGWSFRFPGQIARPFIRPWAPFKQVVAFNISPTEIWVGDGTSLKPESMTLGRMAESLDRCAKAIGREPREARTLRGYRPYVRGLTQPALLTEFARGQWYASGGAKNGTLGAAWAAARLVEKLG